MCIYNKYKRLQNHKTNLNYNKIIKIVITTNMNEAIHLENKIKKLIKYIKIILKYLKLILLINKI